MQHIQSYVLYAMLFSAILMIVGIPLIILGNITAALQEGMTSGTKAIAVITATQGKVIGEVTPQAAIFRGIPFSQPPTGELRWKRPHDPVDFPNGIWNATYSRPGCPQHCTYKSKKYSCPTETNEDCLYLNIWVPYTFLSKTDGDDVVEEEHYTVTLREKSPLAVMVYLHGGNFVTGAGSALLYEGRFLAQQGDVIVVTTNYRLGALGFLVQGEGNESIAGNFGIWDQISALKWVKKNIKNFGGDPEKVTLFGQSSGAESVAVLLTSAHSDNLFHRAGLISDPFSLPIRHVEDAKQFGLEFIGRLGCTPGDMACLQNANVEDILDASEAGTSNALAAQKKLITIQPWGPVVDGDAVPDVSLNALKEGKFHMVPIIMGTTTDEGLYFVPFAIKVPLSTIFYEFAVRSLFGAAAQAILSKYPAKCVSSCDNRGKIGAIITDYVFTCPTRQAMTSVSLNDTETWLYSFAESLPFPGLWDFDICEDKACHCADLPYIFNNLELSDFRFGDAEERLARRIGAYWSNFAKYGNPNGKNEFRNRSTEEFTTGKYHAEYWLRFRESGFGSYSAIRLQSSGDSISSDPFDDICDFWDSLESYGNYKR